VVVVNYRAAEEVEGFVASLAISEPAPLEVHRGGQRRRATASVERLSGREDIILIASGDNAGFRRPASTAASRGPGGDLVLIANPGHPACGPNTLGVLPARDAPRPPEGRDRLPGPA